MPTVVIGPGGNILLGDTGLVKVADGDLSDCCCDTPDPGCGCDDVPASVVVNISGVANAGACTDCDSIINGSYEVDIIHDTFLVGETLVHQCTGQLKMPGPDCFDYSPDAPGNFWILVTILDQGSGTVRYDVKITDGDAPESFRQADFAVDNDCCSVSGAVAQYFAPIPDCDWSGATVTVTAVC